MIKTHSSTLNVSVSASYSAPLGMGDASAAYNYSKTDASKESNETDDQTSKFHESLFNYVINP